MVNCTQSIDEFGRSTGHAFIVAHISRILVKGNWQIKGLEAKGWLVY